MKNLKNVITGVSLMLMMFMSVNVSAQEKVSTEEIEKELKIGMASFVESLRTVYKPKMSYKEFVFELKGPGNSTAMPETGDALLKKGYSYLSKGTSYEGIIKYDSGIEIAAAALYVNSYNCSNDSGGDLALFGMSSDGKVGMMKKGGCKWYQVGCHLRNIFGDKGGDKILAGLVELILRVLSRL